MAIGSKRVWKLKPEEVERVLPQLLRLGLDGNRFLGRGDEYWQKLVDAVSNVNVRRNLDDKLVIPVRPIEGVFNGKLSYGTRVIGDPKMFFLENYDVYGGITKCDLDLFDTSLYQRLYSWGFLDECINIETEAKSVFFDENQRRIVMDAYQVYDGCINKAARSLGFISRTALKRMWVHDFGFEIKKPGENIPYFVYSPEKVKEMLFVFVKEGNNALRTAKKFGCSTTTVIKYAKLNGLEIRIKGMNK